MSSITGPPPVQHEPPPPSAPPPSRPPPHKRHPGLWIAALAAVAVVVAVGAGIGIGASVGQKTPTATSSSSPATTQPSQPATPTPPQESAPPPAQPSGPIALNVGEPLTVTQDGVDVGTLTISSVDVTSQPPDQYSDGPANGYFLIAHVKFHVRNDYTQGFPINPFDFYTVVNGQHYEYGNGNAMFVNTTLNAATLGAGESTTGSIAFDVPAPHGKIAYAPNLSGGPIAFWRFPGSGTSV